MINRYACLFVRFDSSQIGPRLPENGRRVRARAVSRAQIYCRLFAAPRPLSNGLWPFEQQPEKRCRAAFSDRAEVSDQFYLPICSLLFQIKHLCFLGVALNKNFFEQTSARATAAPNSAFNFKPKRMQQHILAYLARIQGILCIDWLQPVHPFVPLVSRLIKERLINAFGCAETAA